MKKKIEQYNKALPSNGKIMLTDRLHSLFDLFNENVLCTCMHKIALANLIYIVNEFLQI